jgi:DNA helicase-2/ATP-dependent DNA helicase PcrA
MSKESVMQDLNPQQREALEYTDGPLLVLAGAGSGKTKVISHKFALLKSKAPRVDPYGDLTNKAAGEMSERIKTLSAGT